MVGGVGTVNRPVPGELGEPPKPTPVGDIDRVLGGAVHEMGHIAVFGAAGIPMSVVAIRRKYFNELGVVGGVMVQEPPAWTPVVVEAVLVGTMAGMAAHQHWLEVEHHWPVKAARTFANLGGGGDRPLYEFLQWALQSPVPMHVARARAELEVQRHWPKIMRCAPVLRRYREMRVRKLVKA